MDEKLVMHFIILMIGIYLFIETKIYLALWFFLFIAAKDVYIFQLYDPITVKVVITIYLLAVVCGYLFKYWNGSLNETKVMKKLQLIRNNSQLKKRVNIALIVLLIDVILLSLNLPGCKWGRLYMLSN
jgi:hypothetical protein